MNLIFWFCICLNHHRVSSSVKPNFKIMLISKDQGQVFMLSKMSTCSQSKYFLRPVVISTEIASSLCWKDFRDPSCYLEVLQRGLLFLLNSKSLLLVRLIDVRHLVILWPLLSTHLTAGACRFVQESAHCAGPAELHTTSLLLSPYIPSQTADIMYHSVCNSDLRFRSHSRFRRFGFRK